MNDDALRAIWISNQPAHEESLMTTVAAVLEEDRADQQKERLARFGAAVVRGLLCPALLWFTAFGKTPLVRGGYALMAVGAAVMLSAEWMNRTRSRKALPGPVDTRSQLQTTASLLSRQVTHYRACAVWSAPVFLGAALIGAWIYQERSQTAGAALWLAIAAAWVAASIMTSSKGRKLDERRARMERLLSDLG